MIVLDGENCILGRVASYAAKKIMQGEEVSVVNAEKMLILGGEADIIQLYKGKMEIRDIGNPGVRSPNISRRPDLLVKRTIRGMLPRKSKRGLEAERRAMAYMGVPKQFEGKSQKVFELRDPNTKRITILYLCKQLGWKGN